MYLKLAVAFTRRVNDWDLPKGRILAGGGERDKAHAHPKPMLPSPLQLLLDHRSRAMGTIIRQLANCLVKSCFANEPINDHAAIRSR